MRAGGRGWGGEQAQAVVLLAVVLAVLLAIAGFVIDYGNWMVTRRQLQNAADAAALAGATKIPAGISAAQSAAQATYAKNGRPSDSVTISQSTALTTNDSITVTVHRTVSTWFTGILGLHSVQVAATARATIESYTKVNGAGVMPWGVLQASYVPGQAYTIYTKTTNNANNGAISLPYVSATNCPDPNGANAYKDEISGALTPCAVNVGETVQTKPGDNSGPTAQGLNSRITTWQTLAQIVQFNSDSTTTLLNPSSPQLVLVPVLTNPSGQSAWPNGTSSPMTVVGFAWFVITSCGDPLHPSYCANNDGKQVNGVFVSLDGSPSTGTSSTYQPTQNTAFTEALTQ